MAAFIRTGMAVGQRTVSLKHIKRNSETTQTTQNEGSRKAYRGLEVQSQDKGTTLGVSEGI